MMAIASAVGAGLSLRGEQTSRELGLLKRQLTAVDAQLVCTLLSQVQDLADRDVAGALQSMKAIIDSLRAAVASATGGAGGVKRLTTAEIPQVKSVSSISVKPLLQDDLVRLGQRLTRLENALVKRPASLTVGQAVQRVRFTLDRGATLVASAIPAMTSQTIAIPVTLKR